MKAIKTMVLVLLLLIPAMNVHAGSLDLIQPQINPESAYRVIHYDTNQIILYVNGEYFTIASRFSTPSGTWVTGAGYNGYFTHTRTLIQKNGYIHITDTFKNLQGDNLPVIQRHTANMTGRMKKAWCSGRTDVTASTESANPTIYATTTTAGIGFMALSDAMQVHMATLSSNDDITLADPFCVIPSGSTYSAEWVIVPTQRPDFWDFVNACRRIRNVNFTLNHMFAQHPTAWWDDNRLSKFIRNKSANVVSLPILWYNNYLSFGTLFQKYIQAYPNSFSIRVDRIHRLAPNVKALVYFHSYLDNSDPADLIDYSNDRSLLPDGTQAVYYSDRDRPRAFFLTATNKWGQAMAKNVDSIFNECKADGVYWDGMSVATVNSKYHYGEPWDGISGDINSTGQLIRLKSSTMLLGKDWIVSQVKKIMEKGTLFTNSQPEIRSIYDLHFQGFTESPGEWSFARAILYSPVALDNSSIENNMIDAYHWMIKALNYGCLFNWYLVNIEPEYETLTKYMFPITPIELREGYIIGQERIVTNRSGTFGWGDNSVHEVHLFNDKGREVPCVKAPTRTTKSINGNIYTELQLAENWTAAIIRHPEGWTGSIGYCPKMPWLNLLLSN